MADLRLLPHLAVACCEVLGEEEPREIPASTRVDVAQKARVSQNTVDRFLRAETVPRGEDLDRMVTAVAAVAEVNWLVPWQRAVARAIEEGEAEPLSGAQAPAVELQRILGEAAQRAESTGSRTATPKPASQKK